MLLDLEERRQDCPIEQFESAPNRPAVFLIWPREGAPYLARTTLLRRRLQRLLRERDHPSRLLNLRNVAERIEFWLSGSQLESSLVFYELARRQFPDLYRKLTRMRMPAYVKLLLANPLPRTLVTTRLGGGRGVHYGPFRTRAAAEQFEAQFLDLFQIRRCQENLEPSPSHPGCIYGEMNLCLRPCQEVVSIEEYASEVHRVEQFLATSGASLLEATGAARERASQELNFEEAAREHKRYQRIEQVLSLRDDLVRDIETLHGVAITTSAEVEAVELWFVTRGCWQAVRRFTLAGSVSLDQRLREVIAAVELDHASPRPHRDEHLALLARWYYSSWREGEWLAFESLDRIPYRKLVNAVARVAKGQTDPKPAATERE